MFIFESDSIISAQCSDCPQTRWYVNYEKANDSWTDAAGRRRQGDETQKRIDYNRN